MRAQIDHADHLAGDALIQQVAHREEIAQGLGHLPALDLEHLVVQPVAREIRTGMGAAALRDLVLVVGELQVDPAGMDIEACAK